MRWTVFYILVSVLCLPSLGRNHEETARARARALLDDKVPHFTFPELKIPRDVQGWLAAREGRFHDIRPGNEKGIQWANKSRSKTEFALIYLHGYSASRGEIQPVMENAGRELGANVFFTRLKGHGRTTEAMTEAELKDWFQDTWEAILVARRLGKKVVIVGTSTGASLSLWLAHHKPEMVDGLVLVSPNFAPKDRRSRLMLSGLGKKIVWVWQGNYREWEPEDALDRKYYTYKQPMESLIPMLHLTDHSRDLPLENIKVPTLALYTENDGTVDTDEIKKHIPRIPGARLVHLPEADQHILTGDLGSSDTTPKVTKMVKEFVHSLNTPEK